MIYTRFGLAVNVIANCGQYQLEEFVAPVTLVKLELDNILSLDEKTIYYRFAEFLKADEGFHEIDQAVQNAEVIELGDDELDAAIKEAL